MLFAALIPAILTRYLASRVLELSLVPSFKAQPYLIRDGTLSDLLNLGFLEGNTMAEFSHGADLQQGFNFKPDLNLIVMHVKKFSIGDKEFKADLKEISDPTDPSKKVELVGVGSYFYWDGAFTSHMEFQFNVSNANKVDVVQLTMSEMKKTDTKIAFDIYAFDDAADQKKWYKAFSTDDKEITGAIAKNGNYCIGIDNDKDPTVPIPPNFRMWIHIDPDQAKQQDHLAAFAVGKNQAFKWGVVNS
jgi:hypothetical protein